MHMVIFITMITPIIIKSMVVNMVIRKTKTHHVPLATFKKGISLTFKKSLPVFFDIIMVMSRNMTFL